MDNEPLILDVFDLKEAIANSNDSSMEAAAAEITTSTQKQINNVRQQSNWKNSARPHSDFYYPKP